MRRQGINGLVVVSFLVDQQGAVQETKVVKSSNGRLHAAGHRRNQEMEVKPPKKTGRRSPSA